MKLSKLLASKLFAGVACLSASLTFGGHAFAKEYADATTHLAMTAPDEWKSEEGDTLTLSAPDSEAQVVVMPVSADDVKATLAALDTELAKVITDIKVDGEAKNTEIGGMPVVHISGTGEHAGVAVHLTLAVVDAGDDCLIILAFGTDAGLAAHADAVNAIFNSVHKE